MNFQKAFCDMTDGDLRAIIDHFKWHESGYNIIDAQNARNARAELEKRSTEGHTPATRRNENGDDDE